MQIIGPPQDFEIDEDHTEEVQDRSSISRRKYEDTDVETSKIAKKTVETDTTEAIGKEQKSAATA